MNILFCNSLFKYYLHGKCCFESDITEKKGNRNSSSLVRVTVSFDSKPGVKSEKRSRQLGSNSAEVHHKVNDTFNLAPAIETNVEL